MQVFAKSDIGRERQLNEDFYYASADTDKIKLFILADGMGGYNGGEVASKLSVESIRKYVYKNLDATIADEEYIKELLTEALKYANKVVFSESKGSESLNGMGTTTDCCLIFKRKLYIAHIGDSRVYRIRNDYMRKLTKDHSYVQQLLDEGKISKEEAIVHPKKNMLLKALGCTEEIEPDIIVKNFQKDDILVMCSDGLSNMLSEEDIKNIIKEDINVAAEGLVEKANDNGGLDNITVIIVK